MSDRYQVTSDVIKLTEYGRTVINESYKFPPEITLSWNNNNLSIAGRYIYAVSHVSNIDVGGPYIQPGKDRFHFLADVYRLSENNSIMITEIDHPGIDAHPVTTKFHVNDESVGFTNTNGNSREWPVSDYGYLTPSSE